SQADRLFIVVHHLAIDGVSWRILIEHLLRALQQLANGQAIDLGPKSSSYRQWAQQLHLLAQTPRFLQQQDYWLRIQQATKALPMDKVPKKEQGRLTMETVHNKIVYLNKKQTKALLQKSNRAYRTEINDLLLAALVQTFYEWTTVPQLSIGLEGHGRNDFDPSIDTSNTVGWFTNLFPLLLEWPAAASVSEQIRSIKTQIRAIPEKGMGYGLLRYHHPDPEIRQTLADGAPEIVFNYLGQIDNLTERSEHLQLAFEPIGDSISKQAPWPQQLEINAYVTQGRLALDWSYSSRQYYKKTIHRLSRQYINNLSTIITHCQQKEQADWSPTDYGLGNEVSISLFDQFMTRPFKGIPLQQSMEALYRLSPMQEGMLFHGLFDQDSAAYTEQMVFDCTVQLDETAFVAAWQHLVDTYSVLRTGYFANELNLPVQVVFQKAKLPIVFLDYRKFDPDTQSDQLQQFIDQDIHQRFDFQTAPLMRVAAIRMAEAAYKIVWTHHHLLLDGWSVPVFLKHLLDTYEHLVKKQTLPSRPVDQYRDYIQYLSTVEVFAAQAFWQNYLTGFEQTSLLPFVAPRVDRNKGQGPIGTQCLRLTTSLTQAIQQYAKQQHLTVNSIVQGIWGLLLSRYTGQSDCLFGVTVSGRPAHLDRAEERVGLYINTLPLRVQIKEEQSLIQYFQTIQQEHTQARTHQYSSINDIQHWIGHRGDLFDSILVFENYPIGDVFTEAHSLRVNSFTSQEQTNYLLTIAVTLGQSLEIDFHYNAALLEDAYVDAISQHFQNVFQQIVVQQVKQLAAIDLLSAKEKHQILFEFNPAPSPLPKEKNILEVFQTWVKRRGQQTAVVFDDQTWTYADVDRESHRIAAVLQAQYQVKAGDRVGIHLERSQWMIFAIFGILKAGAAYVPIGLEHPAQRRQWMIEDAGLQVILTTQQYQAALTEAPVQLYLLDQINELSLTTKYTPPKIEGHDPAYLIYTSGTTGRPKGTIVAHRNVINLTQANESFRFSPEERVIFWINFSFDAAVFNLFNTLLNGSSLYVIPEKDFADPRQVKQFIQKHQINSAAFSTAFFNTLVDFDVELFRGFRNICFGGEPASAKHINKAFSVTGPGVLSNSYGPTEATVCSTNFLVQEAHDAPTPIGPPIANTRIYLVDSAERLVGIGVVGEIWIGGIGVAQGYLNRPELTAQRFCPDPFSENPEDRIYKTGDLARWLPDGQLVFIGRKDQQVKIRGYRIELAEIEKALQQWPSIRKALVLAQKDQQAEKRLVAYLVGTKSLDVQAIKTQLKKQLPAFMIPSVFVELEQFPLTANGKIDHRALPSPQPTELPNQTYLAPRNATEQQLVDIWQNLLGHPSIGISDDFFELGGHSLLATRMVSAIRHYFQIEISVRDLFTLRSIEALAPILEQKTPVAKLDDLHGAPKIERPPLSFAQERLWFIHQLQGSIQYHLPAFLHLEGEINTAALETAFHQVLERHSILRTLIKAEKGEAYQEVIQVEGLLVEVISDVPLDQINERLHTFLHTPFDLTNELPIRIQLLLLGDQQQLLAISIHHIAADGWSINILLKELSIFYQAACQQREPLLPPLLFQYTDFSVWQKKHLSKAVLTEKLQYWKTQLKGLTPLQLPTDCPRPKVQSTRGATHRLQLTPSEQQALKELAKTAEATLFMVVLAAFKVLLYRYSGQADICVGSPVANRTRKEVEPLVGFFVNTLPLRSHLEDDLSFIDLIQQVKYNTLDAFAYQEVPFEKIVEAVEQGRDRSRSPIFQVLFDWQDGAETEAFELAPNISTQLRAAQYEPANYDLTLSILENADGLNLEFLYCADLFTSATIVRMLQHFRQLLTEITLQPKASISQFNLLSEKEQQQILQDFNATTVAYPLGQNILDLFDQALAKHPDQTALLLGDKSWTLSAIHQKANQLAHYLRKQGYQKQDFIGICLDRSENLLMALLAVLKIGAVYVPIDPKYPRERIAHTLTDAEVQLVLCQSPQVELLNSLSQDIPLLILDQQWSIIREERID
ncbi:MAG: amino acid adenylation domain-containing protein, partial [Bacteroidota bacterium]